MAKTTKLEARIQIFVHEYAVDFNGTRAAGAAGYQGDENTLSTRASQLLHMPEVQAELKALLNKRKKKLKKTAMRVVRELKRLAFSDLSRVAPWGPDGVTVHPCQSLDEADRRAVAEVVETETTSPSGSVTRKVKVKLHNKPKALELLGRHAGTFDQDGKENDGEEPAKTVIFLPDNGRE